MTVLVCHNNGLSGENLDHFLKFQLTRFQLNKVKYITLDQKSTAQLGGLLPARVIKIRSVVFSTGCIRMAEKRKIHVWI